MTNDICPMEEKKASALEGDLKDYDYDYDRGN